MATEQKSPALNVTSLPSQPSNLLRKLEGEGLKKTAVLLVFLGEKVSAEVFRQLTDDEVRLVSQAISDLGLVRSEICDDVLRQCHRELVSEESRLRGDSSYVRKVVETAFDPNVAEEILGFLAGQSSSLGMDVKMIRTADPQLLSKLIQDEHPQTIAVLLSYLDPKPAAEVIRLLGEDLRREVATRLAQLDQISQPVRNKLTEIIAEKLREGGQFAQGSHGGLRTVAEIFNRMDRNMSRESLEAIERENPSLALAIRNLMFVFDDILLLSDLDMRKIIQKVDKNHLVQALKGTPGELRDHFYRNMSKRAVEMLQEDMEARGPVRITDAEAARQEVVAAVRELEAAGEIDLRSAVGDQYVV